MEVFVVVSLLTMVKLVGLLKRRYRVSRRANAAQGGLGSRRPLACTEVTHGTQ